ncbi:MAG: hypothetical protein IJ383_00010 [Bacteroidales bacterium]|nr:hypothetical protein [Bacteroidales bacterium]
MKTNCRNRRLNIRLTELEYVDFMQRMDSAGYKSVSRYVRKKLFSTRVMPVRRAVQEEKLMESMRLLVAEVKKIGVNYNQVVKSYNASKSKISSYGTERNMKELYKLTNLLVQEIQLVKELLVGNGNQDA